MIFWNIRNLYLSLKRRKRRKRRKISALIVSLADGLYAISISLAFIFSVPDVYKSRCQSFAESIDFLWASCVSSYIAILYDNSQVFVQD